MQLEESVSRPSRFQQLLALRRLTEDEAAAMLSHHGLTPAEARVAAMIGLGASSDEVQDYLGITSNTLKTHLGRACSKLGVAGRANLRRKIVSLL